MKYTELTYWTLIVMNLIGRKSLKDLSSEYGIPFYSVRAIFRRFKRHQNPLPYMHTENCGRSRLSLDVIGHILNIQNENKSFSLAQIKRELMSRGIITSKSTIHNYRHFLGFKRRKIMSVPILEPRHKLKRLEWCREMLGKDWKMLAFTDESIFEINYTNQSIWYLDKNEVKEAQKEYFQKNQKVMISGIFTWRGKSRIKMWRITNLDASLDERVNSALYKSFLEEFQHDVRSLYPHKIELVLDNAKPHLKYARAFLTGQSPILSGNYQPAVSPDIQPSELIWAWMKKKVYSKSFSNFENFIQVIRDIWEEMPLELVRRCIDHCRRRCQAVVDENGGWPF
jgi:transposase